MFWAIRFFGIAMCTLLFSGTAKGQCQVQANLDTASVCAGDTVWLAASGANTFEWEGDAGLSCTNCAQPYVVLSDSSQYVVVKGTTQVNQFATNGNFSAGNTGFLTNYVYNATSIWNEGTYAVGPNPNAVHPNFGSWGDHTTGSGNYMLINGATTGTPILWRQTVNFPPGVQVTMKWWMLTFVTPPGSVQLKTFGTNVGGSAATPASTGVWQQTSRTFTMPASGTVILNMVTNSSALAGNDFGLDDITFEYQCTSRDTVWLVPKQEAQLAMDTTALQACDSICFTFSNSLDSTGALSYQWFFSDGTTGAGPIFQHCVEGEGVYSGYVLTTSAAGCTDSMALPRVELARTRLLDSLGVRGEDGFWYDGTYVVAPGTPLEYTAYFERFQGQWRPDDSLVVSAGLQGQAFAVTSAQWTQSGNLSGEAEPFDLCAYLVTPAGCVDSLCVAIGYLPSVEVPNVFSPNGDGTNDVWSCTWSNTERAVLKIYNRWGGLIYSEEGPAPSWDGTAAGRLSASGVYYYHLEVHNDYTSVRGPLLLQGVVHLLD